MEKSLLVWDIEYLSSKTPHPQTIYYVPLWGTMPLTSQAKNKLSWILKTKIEQKNMWIFKKVNMRISAVGFQGFSLFLGAPNDRVSTCKC